MTVTELSIPGAKLLALRPFEDFRGAFGTSWEKDVFEPIGIPFQPMGAYHSYNLRSGTLRGLHMQRAPHGQAKLVTCVRGAAFDVIVDVRRDSPSYLRWASVNFEAASGQTLYVPAGCAHGFLTREDDTTIAYLIEGAYRPDAAVTLRWNDAAFGIVWPTADPILSNGDRTAPDFQP